MGLIAYGITMSVLANKHAAPAAKPAAAVTMPSNAKNVPVANQFKFGIFTNNPTLSADEQKLGHTLNIMAWFSHWNESLQSNKLTYACSNGYVPEITWESWNGASSNGIVDNPFPLSNIAQGTYDNYIKQQLQVIKDTCKNQTVIIRFDHEMDTPVGTVSYYPWQGDPTAYIAAWQHVVSISRSIDPNIKWLWSPNRGTSIAAQYYPGSQWVDYVGLTLNRGTLEEQIPSFATFYQENQAVLQSFNKPIIISETTDQEGLGMTSKAQWVNGMFNFIEQNPKILAVVWFDGSPAYSYDSSPATLAAFQQGLNSIEGKD
jgi:beta-mannanase